MSTVSAETDLRLVYLLPDGTAPLVNAVREQREASRRQIVEDCPDCQWIKSHIMHEQICRSSDLGYEIIAARRAYYQGESSREAMQATEAYAADERRKLYWYTPITERCPRHVGWADATHQPKGENNG